MSEIRDVAELLMLPGGVSVKVLTHAKVTVVTFRDGAQDFHAQSIPEPAPHLEMVAELLARRAATKVAIDMLEAFGNLNGDTLTPGGRDTTEAVIDTLRV